jgi:hypothetical protein
MPQPFDRRQVLQNRAFVKALTRTGNLRLAARETGIAYGTIQHRRRAHPEFARQCDAALTIARAALQRAARRVRETAASRAGRDDIATGEGYRTRGGEGVVVCSRDGSVQLRRAHPGKLTHACEQAFLSALSATANVRLSAAAAGASTRAFYRRRRNNPGFAREMRLALEAGYERLEMALLQSSLPGAYADDDWRHNDPPPIPQMTANQALQLLYLHQKEARLQSEPPHIKRRRGESHEAHGYRMAEMYNARLQRDREAVLIAEAARRERGEGGEGGVMGPKILPELPALDQVTGWSRADAAKVPHDPTRALFGGWRAR